MQLLIDDRTLTCACIAQEGVHELWEIREDARDMSWFFYRDASKGGVPGRYVGFRHPGVSRNGGTTWTIWPYGNDSPNAVLLPLLERHLGPDGRMPYGKHEELYCELLHNGEERLLYWFEDCGFDTWTAKWPQIMECVRAQAVTAAISSLPSPPSSKDAWL